MKDFALVALIALVVLFAFNSAGAPGVTSAIDVPGIPMVNTPLMEDVPFIDVPLVDTSMSDILSGALDAVAAAGPVLEAPATEDPTMKLSITGGSFPRATLYDPVSDADVDVALERLGLKREDTIVLCTGPDGARQNCRLQTDVYTGWTVTRSGSEIVIE